MPGPSEECYEGRLDILCMFNKPRGDPEGKPPSVGKVSLLKERTGILVALQGAVRVVSVQGAADRPCGEGHLRSGPADRHRRTNRGQGDVQAAIPISTPVFLRCGRVAAVIILGIFP